MALLVLLPRAARTLIVPPDIRPIHFFAPARHARAGNSLPTLEVRQLPRAPRANHRRVLTNRRRPRRGLGGPLCAVTVRRRRLGHELVGLGAQLVDGSLGMAYGVTSTTLLLAIGTNPAAASATVHLAEIGTTLASGLRAEYEWVLARARRRPRLAAVSARPG